MRPDLEIIQQWVQPGHHVLDLGCGLGLYVRDWNASLGEQEDKDSGKENKRDEEEGTGGGGAAFVAGGVIPPRVQGTSSSVVPTLYGEDCSIFRSSPEPILAAWSAAKKLRP